MTLDVTKLRSMYLMAGSFYIASFLGCGSGSNQSAPPATAPNTTTPYQMLIGESVVTYMQANSPSALPLLNGTKPWIILDSGDSPYPGQFAPAAWNAQYMIRFASFATMASQFASNSIPGYVTWIMYDNEPNASPTTPANELANPPLYYQMAAALVHGAGLKFFATAGLSGTTSQNDAMHSQAALYDAYDIQSQTGESTVAAFDASIKSSADMFLMYNPSLIIAAGYGDYANQQLLTPAQIDPFLDSFTSNVAAWANFGPHTPTGAPSIPAEYGYFVQTLEDSLTETPVAPLN